MTDLICNYDSNGILESKTRYNETNKLVYNELYHNNEIAYKMEIKDNDTFEWVNHQLYYNLLLNKTPNNNKLTNCCIVDNTYIICNYKNGELDGEYKKYSDNNLLISCYFKNDELDGEYVMYDIDNKYDKTRAKKKCNYVNGKLEGKYYEDNNGTTIISNYKNDILDGEHKTIYNSGRTRDYHHCYYKNGKIDGEYKIYSNNNKNHTVQLIQHRHYKDDILNGSCYQFDNESNYGIMNLSKYRYYENGVKIIDKHIYDFHNNNTNYTEKYYTNNSDVSAKITCIDDDINSVINDSKNKIISNNDDKDNNKKSKHRFFKIMSKFI